MNIDDKNYHEILQLTEKFVEAVENSDEEAASQLVGGEMKIEFKTPAGSYIEDFDKNRLIKKPILIKPSEAKHIYIKQSEAQVVYEMNGDFHFVESGYYRGIIRQTYSYKKFENNWKLNYLKTEIRRFSGYQLKESLLGLLKCLIRKTVKYKWILKA